MPPGIHDAQISEIAAAFVYDTQRQSIWTGFLAFIDFLKPIPEIDLIYVDGSFVTTAEHPNDVDVVIEYPDVRTWMRLRLLEPFVRGRAQMKVDYNVDLMPCLPILPAGLNDLREFFQYLRPEEATRRGLPLGTKKGILRLSLRS